MKAFVAGSRLGGWWVAGSDLDLRVVVDPATTGRLGESASFIWHGITVDVSVGPFLHGVDGKLVGFYDLRHRRTSMVFEDDVCWHLIRKRRPMNDQVLRFIRTGRPCDWFAERERALAESVSRYMQFLGSADAAAVHAARQLAF